MNRKLGPTLVAVALVMSASAVLACERHADAREAKDATAVAANGDAKGCDKPCVAHARTATETKASAAVAHKPCAAREAKACPKKPAAATAALKTEPAKDAVPVEDTVDHGTHR